MKVYLDNSASSKEDPRILKAMLPYFSKHYANASALHLMGQEALAGVDWARFLIKNYFGAENNQEIIFTSSASEANNFAIKGAALAWWQKHKKPSQIVISNIEHESVLQPCLDLEKLGLAKVRFLKADKYGLVNPADIKKLIKPNTILVSIAYVSNVLGTVQPIKQISQELKNAKFKGYFHTDAAQAILTQPIKVKELGIDSLTFSGHKIYGPKGSAGLYLKKGTAIMPLISGGEQEYGWRASTLNTAAIVGLGKAFEFLQKEQSKIITHLKELRLYFYKEVMKIKSAQLNGSYENSSPHILNFYFPQKSSQDLLILLDQKGIEVSAGSACVARTLKPSRVIKEISGSNKIASHSLRFSFSKYTSLKELEYTAKVLKLILKT